MRRVSRFFSSAESQNLASTCTYTNTTPCCPQRLWGCENTPWASVGRLRMDDQPEGLRDSQSLLW